MEPDFGAGTRESPAASAIKLKAKKDSGAPGKGDTLRPTNREAWEKAPWPPVVTHRQASRRRKS